MQSFIAELNSDIDENKKLEDPQQICDIPMRLPPELSKEVIEKVEDNFDFPFR